MHNILSSFLSSCSVKHTLSFTEKLVSEHPNRNNMLGLKQMLELYGIKSEGVLYKDKLQAEMVFPCILHISGAFVVGMDIHEGSITYSYEGKERTKPVEEFCKMWTGHALMPVSDLQDAMEPDYALHRTQELWHGTLKGLGILLPIIAWGLVAVSYLPNLSLLWATGCVFDVLGLIISYFLMEKQIFRKSEYGDKVCSAFHLNNCNDIQFSSKSKVGAFSWSEIGLGYFTGRLFCRAFLPYTSVALATFGWVAMAFGIWSIWQQAKVLRKFCLLCTLVQVFIWTNGIVDAFCHLPFDVTKSSLLLGIGVVGIVLALSIMAVHIVSSGYSKQLELQETIWKLKALKYDNEVFLAKLHKQEHYETSEGDSRILLGNKNSETRITILSNPHCNPCAQMHKRVDTLINTYGDKFCVQYIFSSFNSSLDDSCRFLISSYLQLEQPAWQKVYQQWFDGEKYHAKDYISTIPVTLSTKETEDEMARHKAWSDKTGLSATPTVLLNGYVLPDEYEIEDIPLLC